MKIQKIRFDTNESNVAMGIALDIAQQVKRLNKMQEKNKMDTETYIKKRKELQEIIKEFKNRVERFEND